MLMRAITILWLWTVATVLTVYGIETSVNTSTTKRAFCVATVLTVYGIETITELSYVRDKTVATVLTVYGIETQNLFGLG